MALTTFQGPVRSLGGFYSQGPATTVALTVDTTLSPTTHGGKIILLNNSSLTLTLPEISVAADPTTGGPGAEPNTLNNTGLMYNIVFLVDCTLALKCGGSGTPGDLFVGSIILGKTSAAEQYIPNGSSNDVINTNTTTKGGIAGSSIQVVPIYTNKWQVSGVLVGSGSLETPFADA